MNHMQITLRKHYSYMQEAPSAMEILIKQKRFLLAANTFNTNLARMFGEVGACVVLCSR